MLEQEKIASICILCFTWIELSKTCLSRERELERDDDSLQHARTEQEGNSLQATEGPHQDPIDQHRDLGSPSVQKQEKSMSVGQAIQSMALLLQQTELTKTLSLP